MMKQLNNSILSDYSCPDLSSPIEQTLNLYDYIMHLYSQYPSANPSRILTKNNGIFCQYDDYNGDGCDSGQVGIKNIAGKISVFVFNGKKWISFEDYINEQL